MTPRDAKAWRHFVALDKALVAAGFPATSPWWRDTLERFYTSGRRQLICRAGRRAGKSSTLCRLAVVEGVFGGHKVPPGDVGVVAFVSTTRDEASSRLRTIKAILDVLGTKYRERGDTIELADAAVMFRVFTASVAGVVGFTSVAAICDELCRWKDSDTGANPATEVLASLRPTMATQPHARIILSSSPLGTQDAHYDAFEAGDTAFQLTASAPTWVANPTLTEADTHALEPDEDVWRREYAAIPQSEAETSFFTAADVDRATRKAPVELGPEPGVMYVAAMDPATRGDAWTLAVGGIREGKVRSVVLVREWRGSRQVPLSPRAVLAEVAGILRPYGLDYVWTDQASGDALRDLGTAVDLAICIEPTTAANKLPLYENLKTRIAAGEVELPPDPQVRADILSVRRRITRVGVSLDLPRINGRHADFAPAIALVVAKTRVAAETLGPAVGTRAFEEAMMAEMERQEEERVRRELEAEWWEGGAL